MATYTENYNLILPEATDIYDAEEYNSNFKTLDAALASVAEQIETLSNTPASAIKSIQHIVTSESTTHEINPVDPSKCIVILERLKGSSNMFANVDYTLNTSTLETTITSPGYLYTIGFWIIEFN